MKEPKIIVKDIYKSASEAERCDELTKSITKLIRTMHEEKAPASLYKSEL